MIDSTVDLDHSMHTKAYTRFMGSGYPGMSENESIGKLATASMDTRAKIAKIGQDETMTKSAQILATDDLFSKDEKLMDGLYNAALQSIDKATDYAQSQLFSSQALDTYQDKLLVSVLDLYNKPGTDTMAMLNNPKTAKMLSELSKNGLLPSNLISSINKKHSPDAVATLENSKVDYTSLANIAKEFSSYTNVTRNSKEAARIRSLKVSA